MQVLSTELDENLAGTMQFLEKIRVARLTLVKNADELMEKVEEKIAQIIEA